MYRYYKIKKQDILLITFLIVTNIAVMLNIPIFRQVLGSIFLTLLPGLLILSIMKLNDINQVKKILLTIGLSLSFLMFYGLLVNTLVLSFGFTDPLSEKWLLLTFNFVIIILYCLNCITNQGKIITFQMRLNQSLNEKLTMLAFIILFPSLSIFGAFLMRTNGNNIVLMFGFFLIIFIMIVVAILNSKVPKNIYPIAIYSIGVFITLAFSLRSEYIFGADVHLEYYLFRVTMANLHWKILDYTALDACLGISLLPAIYQSIMNISHEVYFYKIFYSVLIPVIPLAVYEISRRYIEEIFAFFAALLFASCHVFMWTGANPRTNLAILFFVFAIMTLFSDIGSFNKKMLFIIFISATMVSHYATTYIFFFVLLASCILTQIVKIRFPTWRHISCGGLVLLFFALIFFWYSQVTVGAFNYTAIGFFEGTLRSLPNLFIRDSRGGALPEVLGAGFLSRSVPRQVHVVIQWIVLIVISVGIISMLVNFRRMIGNSIKQHAISLFLKRKIEIEYLLLAIACFGLLVFCVIVPQASTGLGTYRTYFQMMGVLSFIFIIGCISISKHIRITPLLIILIILIPYFMCNTGVIYQIYDFPQEPTLNSKGTIYEIYYIHEEEMESAEWWCNHIQEDDTKSAEWRYFNPEVICIISSGAANILGDVRNQSSTFLVKAVKYDKIQKHQKIGRYLYLRHITVVDGFFIAGSPLTRYNISEYYDIYDEKSKIYGNGGSEIYL